MIDETLLEAEEKMDKAVAVAREDFGTIRTGRATPAMFAKVMGPLLRSPEQGADTLVWLAADDGEPLHTSGGFWLDRARRGLHKVPGTRRTDTPERRLELWEWCEHAAGVQP